jgi:hypothetical protein
MKKISILLIFCFPISNLSAQVTRNSPLTKYLLDTNYIVTSNFYHHKSIDIEISQAKRKYNHGYESPFNIGRVFIKSGNFIIDSLIFPDIKAYGGHAGLDIPERKFSDSLFAIIKRGDYDGRLYLINTKGKVFNFPGGEYFISKDKKLLFSISESDCSGIDIIDLKTLKSIYSITCLSKNPDYWFFYDKKYYYTSLDIKDSVYVYEGPIKGFVSYFMDKRTFKSAEKIKLDF